MDILPEEMKPEARRKESGCGSQEKRKGLKLSPDNIKPLFSN